VQPFTSPEGQHSENSLDFALYAVVVHVGESIQRGHYVAYVKDPRGEWFQMDDHKASPVSLSEVLQVQAYMLFYIQTVHRNAGIDSVNQQTEQVSDSMDEDGTLVADEVLSLQDSKTLTGPEQVAWYSAPMVAEPAEEPLMSHAIALEPPAVSGWKMPVPGEPPTKGENYVSILDMSGVRINYLPSACEHIQSLTDRGSTAQGAPLHEDTTDSIPTVPPWIPPASRAEPTSPEVPTAPVFRQQPPQPQTPLVGRPQPIRADSGATRQADMAELLDHVSQEMIKVYPLIVDLHTASLGNILTLAPVICDLMRHPVPPQVARRILRPQDDRFSLPGLDTITSVELVSAIESSMTACDTAQIYADVILRHTTRLRTADTIVKTCRI